MRNCVVFLAVAVASEHVHVAPALRPAGWTVVLIGDGATVARRATGEAVDLILIDIDLPDRAAWRAAAAIRAMAGPAAHVPILALTTSALDPAELLAGGFDGSIAGPPTAADLRATAARWHPLDEQARAGRFEPLFGRSELHRLTTRFRAQLADALATIDSGDTALAHRIAGIAGMLGFGDVGTAWLRLSEGDASARANARWATRLALASIDRAAASGGDESTADT